MNQSTNEKSFTLHASRDTLKLTQLAKIGQFEQQNMQNEPNLQNAQIDVTPFTRKGYVNFCPVTDKKTNPKRTQSCPQASPLISLSKICKTNPISNFALEMSYIKKYTFKPCRWEMSGKNGSRNLHNVLRGDKMYTQQNIKNYSVILVVLLISLAASSFAQTIYVDKNAKGDNNGSTWANAHTSLQDAISAAVKGDKIWVARGIYKPDRGSYVKEGDRKATFLLKNGVAVYGGFPPGGGQWKDSDPGAYPTFLSGDLKGDDVEVASPSELIDEATRIDNSYHVVTTCKTDSTTVLDGFVITAGNAANYAGAGIYNIAGSPTISNCVITGNLAQCGAGMSNCKDSEPTLTNCIFSGNASKCCSAALRNDYSSSTIKSCTFSRNFSQGNAGAVYNRYCEPEFINCIFNGNSTGGHGGAIQNCTSDAEFTNCIFAANTSQKKGGAVYNCDHGSNPIFTNCSFSANYAKYHGGGIFNEKKSNPKLTSCILWGNIDRDGSNELSQIYGMYMVVNYCCIQGWSGKLEGLENINADPLFSSNPDDGGDGFGDNPDTSDIDESSNDTFGQLQLLPDSPCIDAGDPGYKNQNNETDIQGKPRLTGESIDIGACEYSP